MNNLPGRDKSGKLPSSVPIVYLTRDGYSVCPDCANREVEEASKVIGYLIHLEGESIFCEDCEVTEIKPAYNGKKAVNIN